MLEVLVRVLIPLDHFRRDLEFLGHSHHISSMLSGFAGSTPSVGGGADLGVFANPVSSRLPLDCSILNVGPDGLVAKGLIAHLEDIPIEEGHPVDFSAIHRCSVHATEVDEDRARPARFNSTVRPTHSFFIDLDQIVGSAADRSNSLSQPPGAALQHPPYRNQPVGPQPTGVG